MSWLFFIPVSGGLLAFVMIVMLLGIFAAVVKLMYEAVRSAIAVWRNKRSYQKYLEAQNAIQPEDSFATK